MNRSPFNLALLAVIGLSVTGAFYAPAAAARGHVSVGIGIHVAPPPPRFERVPLARRGYVWTPGHWRWNAPARRYAWRGGMWVQTRPAYRHRNARWGRHGRHGPRGHWHR